MIKTRVYRRQALSILAAASGTVAMPNVLRAAPLTVSVGRQPFAAGNSPITQYMMAHKLFEKAAAQFGYELTVDYRDYPSALPQVEAFVSGNLDLGMWGNTPIIRGIPCSLRHCRSISNSTTATTASCARSTWHFKRLQVSRTPQFEPVFSILRSGLWRTLRKIPDLRSHGPEIRFDHTAW